MVGVLMISFSQAQIKGVTEAGDEVFLYADGTWKYRDEDRSDINEIPINPNAFVKDEKSTFLLKSNNLNVGFYLNPKLWSFKKAVENEDAEYELKLKVGDLYGLIISEAIEIPLENLRLIALENGKSAVPDLKIVKEEYRTVNGLRLLLLQMNGTLQGIKITYYGYYYSNTKGTVQFITYTAQNLIDSYIPEIEKLLNGMVVLD